MKRLLVCWLAVLALCFAAAPVQAQSKSRIAGPTPSTTLTHTSATFSWSAGSGVTRYWLYVGTTSGNNDIHDSGQLSYPTFSRVVSGLPANSSTIYVRIYSWMALTATWEFSDYTYTATNGATASATLKSPPPSSELPGTTAAFEWTTGKGVAAYWLYVGTSAGNNDIYNSGQITNSGATSATNRRLTTLPANGANVYVTLFSQIGGTWQSNAYTYAAAKGVKAGMAGPEPDSVISGITTFIWTAGTNVSAYWLHVGTSFGAANLHDSGQLPTTTKFRTVSGLPTNGAKVYVRLFSLIAGAWTSNDYTYESSAPLARVFYPPPGDALPSTSVCFQWNLEAGASAYWLHVGTFSAGANIFDSGQLSATTQFGCADGLPNNGSTVYVRVWTQRAGVWRSIDYSYSAVGGGSAAARIYSPEPGRLTNSGSAGVSWTTGVNATAYWLQVGTAPAAANIFDSGQVTTTGAIVNALPIDGSTYYARLYSLIGGVWQFNDYTFVAVNSFVPQPFVNGGLPAGGSSTVSWNNFSPAVTAFWLYGGTTSGNSNVHDSGPLPISTASRSMTSLPASGSVYTRLWSQIFGQWVFRDTQSVAFTAAALSAPANGSTLSNVQTFTWNAVPNAVSYRISLGSATGLSDYWSQSVSASSTSVSISGIGNLSGATVHVRVTTTLRVGETVFGGTLFNDYTYVACCGS